MTEFLWTDVADKVCPAVRMSVGMAGQRGDATARTFRSAIFGLIELLLRKRRQQQPQSFELLGIQNAVEQFVIVLECDLLAVAHVTKVRTRGEEDGCRKLRQKV